MMAESLAVIANRIVAEGELSDDPAEAADRLATEIRLERPDVTARGAQTAAARALGVDPPPTSSEATALLSNGRRGGGRRRRARGRRRRVKVPKVLRGRVAPASTFGALIAQSLGLVALYWVLRSAPAVEQVADRIGSAFKWFVDPVGWGQRQP